MKTVLYARVSTSDQTLAHQLVQARAAGFEIDEVVADEGVSGVTTKLADRPQGKRLFDLLREGDVLVLRWVDRLGRDYTDVTDTIRALIARGVVIKTVINNMVFDGSARDPMLRAVRDALIAFMSATAQAQAEATKEAQRAGIEFAKEQGDRYLGRKPSFDRPQFEAVRKLADEGAGVSMIAQATGLSRQAIYRIKSDPAVAEAALKAWRL